MRKVFIREYEKYGLTVMSLFLVVATLPNPIRILSGVFGGFAVLLHMYIKAVENTNGGVVQ
jgi:hypothetical protein